MVTFMRDREGTLRASAGRSILRRFSASRSGQRPGTAPAAAGPARRRGVAPRVLVVISNKICMGSLPGSRPAAVAPIGPRRVLFARCLRRVGRGSKPPGRDHIGGAGRRQHHDPCAVGPLQRQRCRESAARVALWAVHSWGGVVQSALRECLESELAAHSRDVLLAIFACV